MLKPSTWETKESKTAVLFLSLPERFPEWIIIFSSYSHNSKSLLWNCTKWPISSLLFTIEPKSKSGWLLYYIRDLSSSFTILNSIWQSAIFESCMHFFIRLILLFLKQIILVLGSSIFSITIFPRPIFYYVRNYSVLLINFYDLKT